jgi:hypothetical protein
VTVFVLPSCASSSSESSLSESSSSSISSSSPSSSESSSSEEPIVQEIENGGLETGDLSGWTIVSGQAFSSGGVSSQTQVNGSVAYNKEGTYFYRGTNENLEGILESSVFEIAGSGYLTFKLGGAYLQALTYISFVDATTGIEFYRVGNSRFNLPASGYVDYRVENMVDYYVDLSAHRDRLARVRVVDQSTANHGYVTFDGFTSYHETTPDLAGRTLAPNIMPLFTDYAGTPASLYNGNFGTKTLAGYSVIGETGVYRDSHINSSNRLSNRPDETKIGVLRSSAFKVAGLNLMSFRLGATKHPDLTYMSIKKVGTNEEVFRTYSDRWKDADEENTHLYHVDLSKHENLALYLEFVDNSRGDWGLLTIEAIVTHYAAWPSVNDEIAYNLLDRIEQNPTYQAMRAYVDPRIAAIEDATTRTTVNKTFYASIDGISNSKGTWPSVMNYYKNGNTFIITGDIDAMWLRDSSAQVLPYLQFMTIDEDVRIMVKGLLRQQFEFLRREQYANAYNPGGSVFELKFEIDSLIYPLWLAYEYYRITSDDSIYDRFFWMALTAVLDTLDQERDHDDANYRISNQSDRDAGPHEVNTASGLIWSGYRPSDDVCYYKFFIPGNIFAVATLEKMADLLTALGRWPETAARAATMASEVRSAIETYGVYNHPTYGRMYAFEVNGFASDANSSSGKLLMDAANIPSLLAIPWLGYAPKDDATYLNTRAFALSSGNPYYYEGTYAKGIGDPHDGIGGANPHPATPVPWHMALAMQGLTSEDPAEIETMISYMTATTAGTYVMHEAFNADNPSQYSRDWFTWPCALYAHLYLTEILNIDLITEELS